MMNFLFLLFCLNLQAQLTPHISTDVTDQQKIDHFVQENKCKQGVSENGQTEFKTRNGNEQVSYIDERKAQDLFRSIKSQTDKMTFNHPEDGCYSRAYVSAKLLQDLGVGSLKVFIRGQIRVNTPHSPRDSIGWKYHVAPAVCVKQDGQYRLMVFDPSLFEKPVHVHSWFLKMSQHKPYVIQELFTTDRYTYSVKQSKGPSPGKFTEEFMREANEKNNEHIIYEEGEYGAPEKVLPGAIY